MRNTLKLILILFVMLSGLYPGFAQDDAHYSSATLEFDYPAAWEILREDENGIALNTSPGGATLSILTPEVLAALGLDEFVDSAEELEDLLFFMLGAASQDYEPETIIVQGEEGLRYIGDQDAIVIASIGGEYILLWLNADDESLNEADMEAMIELADSLQRPDKLPDAPAVHTPVPTLGSKSNPTPVPPDLTTLHDYDADWETAVAELESLGIIGSGGSLIFRENRAYFEGRGDWFTHLARNSPRTDVVLAATISFRPGGEEASELETCSLMARIQQDSQGMADRFLEVGLDNFGSIFYVDFDRGDPLVGIEDVDNWDLTEPHHYLLLAQDDTVTVYVDGKLVFDHEPVAERSGTFGIALRGLGVRSRCEGTDLWAYEAPSYQPGVCEITAGGSINKRSGPGTNFAQAGQLVPGVTQQAQGKTTGADGFLWWQLEDDSWVRSDIVSAFGDCETVPDIEV